MHDVITIGSATRDVFVKSVAFEVHEGADTATGVEGCFPLGSKIEIDEVVFETGGGATNAAATFARLGYDTACVSSIGNDSNARDVIAALEREHIAVDHLQRNDGAATGYSIIIVAGTGERTILVHRGASKMLDEAKIEWKRLHAQWFYVSSLGGELDIVRTAIEYANEHGIKVAWNPGSAELNLGLDELAPLIERVDVFNLNREEAALLSGIGRADLKGIIEKLRPLPRRALLVTDGQDGTYATSDHETLHSGTIDVPRVNTTGAGDAFGSGFIAGLMKNDDLRFALATGTWNATGVVQDMGAKRGLIRSFPTETAAKKVTIDAWN